jgi:hypothetical protein
MRFYCLGYYDEKKWETLTETEQQALMDECFEYDDVLRKTGHFAGGDGLQNPRDAATLRWKNGKVSVDKGPCIGAKEQLGGILILEAKNKKEAVELMSRHPGVKVGPFEIRAVEDMTAMVAESARRRGKKVA